MATGYRVVLRDLLPGIPFHGREVTDYIGLQDDVVTEPSSSVSDAGGMWVTKNQHRACFLSAYSMVVNVPPLMTRVSVLNATWNDGDVLETVDAGSALQGGTGTYGEVEPDPAVSLVWYRVSALTTGVELSYAEANAAALDVSLQVA